MYIPGAEAGTRYALDIIRELITEASSDYLKNYLARHLGLDYLWSFNPGEWQAWPATNLKPLLSILGNVEELVGVKLRDGALIPAHTRRPHYSEAEFEGCQYVHRTRRTEKSSYSRASSEIQR
jgi:hypothetical protein